MVARIRPTIRRPSLSNMVPARFRAPRYDEVDACVYLGNKYGMGWNVDPAGFSFRVRWTAGSGTFLLREEAPPHGKARVVVTCPNPGLAGAVVRCRTCDGPGKWPCPHVRAVRAALRCRPA